MGHRNPEIRATGIGHRSMHHGSLQNSEVQNLDGSKGWPDLRKYPTETSRTSGITGTESSGKLSLGPKLAGSDQQDLDLFRVRTPVSFSDPSFRHSSRTAEHCCARFSAFGFCGGSPACCKSKKETNTKESSESPCNICASQAVGKYSSTWDHILNELQDQEN